MFTMRFLLILQVKLKKNGKLLIKAVKPTNILKKFYRKFNEHFPDKNIKSIQKNLQKRVRHWPSSRQRRPAGPDRVLGPRGCPARP